jgi:nicotinate-nucleotide adenylyltransferase
MAAAARHHLAIDRMLFVPAGNPPHKDVTGLAPFEDRFRMVEIACEGHPRFSASRIEEGSQHSYTVDTLRRFRKTLGPADRLFFLIGADAFDDLANWHSWQDVVAMTEFIVVSRPGAEYRIAEGARIHRLEGLELAISSSDIRDSIARRAPTPELPPRVRAYIDAHALYR